MAKKYVGASTLTALMKIIKAELAGKMGAKEVLNTLESYNAETDAEKLVAASLIKEIKDQLASIVGEDGEGKVSNADKLDGKDSEEFLQVVNVITAWENYNTEDGVDDNKKAVAAALVKLLKDKIDAFDADGDGKVDVAANAEQLGGEAPEFYAKATDLEGVVKVGEDGLVPSEVLPSYVDDVIEGYMVSATDEETGVTTLTFYEDAEATTAIEPEKGKIYVDVTEGTTGQCYRWSGSTYIEVSSNDMVEISDAEVDELWNAALAEAGSDLPTEEV